MARIFKSGDAALTTHVFGCMNRQYKSSFFRQVPIHGHRRIAADVLTARAEEAFSETQRIFYDKVCANEFDAGGPPAKGFLYETFKRTYLGFYRKELTRSLHYAHKKKTTEAATTMNADWPAYNLPGSIYTLLAAAIGRLKPGCKNLMTLLYLKNEAEEAVLKQTDYKNIHSLRQGASRCRDEVRELLSKDFGID